MINTGISPAIFLIAGALIIPAVKGKFKSAFMILLPLVSFIILFTIPDGNYWIFKFMSYELIMGSVDSLSRVFAYIFTIILFIGVIFSLEVKDDLQHTAAVVYAGSALGIVLAGDFFSLYIFWEIMAVASAFLILAGRTRKSTQAAFRYMMVHIFGGISLLAGIIMHVHHTGSTALNHMTLSSIESYLIFFGIAVNAAIPPLHPWLKDAYPKATATGAVFLSAFTTKSAVYVMARIFPGTELLIWIGVVMTILPIFYAEIENDIRRVLSYSLMNQVGFMLCGIGIGTSLAINGAVSHAFCHILYKALLFMAAGSVLHVTGKIKCTDIGGLYKTMPLTCLFCIVGAASISAFPLFSGFISKSMIIMAAGHEKLITVWFLLQFASAGVIAHAGIKVPYFTFFSHDSGIRAKEPPANMLIAMGVAAFLCILLGVFPKPLYDILPYPVDYTPYNWGHIIGQLQLLMFAILAFSFMIYSGLYPKEIRSVNLDTDWFYRKGGILFYNVVNRIIIRSGQWGEILFELKVTQITCQILQKAKALKNLSIPVGISVAVSALFVLIIFFLS